jgi:hypothetical protein
MNETYIILYQVEHFPIVVNGFAKMDDFWLFLGVFVLITEILWFL